MTRQRATALLGFGLLSLVFLVGGCANSPHTEMADDGKVWMRDDSTYTVQEYIAGCHAQTSVPADFTICMQMHGWRLQTPTANE